MARTSESYGKVDWITVLLYLGQRDDLGVSFWAWYTRGYFRDYEILGGGPLWFIETLLIFSVVYVVWRLAFRRKAAPPVAAPRRGPPGAPSGEGTWPAFHFVRFEYESRPDWFEDCRAGFVVRTGLRLTRISVGTQGADVSGLGHAAGDGQDRPLHRADDAFVGCIARLGKAPDQRLGIQPIPAVDAAREAAPQL